MSAAYRSRVFFGAHVSASGGIHTTLDRAEAMRRRRGAAVHAEPAHVAADEPRSRELRAFKERREELEIAPGGVLAHALYLVNLAAPDDEIYDKSRAALRNTMEVACAIDADGVVFHVGSHSARAWTPGWSGACPRCKEALELCTDTTWLLMEDSAGAGGTIGRSIDELAALFDAATATSASASASTRATSTSRASTSPTAKCSTRCSTRSTSGSGSTGCARCTSTTPATPLGSNRDRHANIGEGMLGNELGVFLSHPKLQGLPAFLEVPGTDKHGPDANELKKVRRLHKRWVATAG